MMTPAITVEEEATVLRNAPVTDNRNRRVEGKLRICTWTLETTFRTESAVSVRHRPALLRIPLPHQTRQLIWGHITTH